LFGREGYVDCESDAHEGGQVKVAIYGMDEVVKHAARQLRNGWWTSKLGPHADIRHKTPYDVEGTDYGTVLKIMTHDAPVSGIHKRK
jgi:hypothetical protein